MVALLLATVLAVSSDASPQPSQPGAPTAAQEGAAADDAARKRLEADIRRELGAQPQQPPAQPSGPGTAGPPSSGTGSNPYARLLPDISAIGDFAGVYDSLDVERLSPRAERDPKSPAGKPKFLFQELELGLQSIIDPYARADIFISFEEGGVNVEEAYLTTLSLPAGLQLRAGKFRSPIGRLNQEHPHTWDFIDAPLALSRIVSSAEALFGPGADLAWLIPLPWFAELHGALQSTSPEFAGSERLTGIAHLQQYFDIGETATLGLGLSAGRMDEPGPGASREVGDVALYLKIRPLSTRAYLALQSEMFGRRVSNPERRSTDVGGYVQAFWRRGAYDGYGLRYDWAPGAATGTEERLSGLLSGFPSEFLKLRMQVAWDRLPGGRSGIEAILHLEFVIGAHGAHPF